MQGAAPNILFVDDDDGLGHAMAMTLEKAGFAVVAERDYIGALRVLESDKPIDLLLTDIVMPDRVHGFALARMARLRRRGLKVIYLTGHDIPASGAIGPVLRKPISEKALVDEIRRALAS